MRPLLRPLWSYGVDGANTLIESRVDWGDVDVPARFRKSKAVGAVFGLTSDSHRQQIEKSAALTVIRISMSGSIAIGSK